MRRGILAAFASPTKSGGRRASRHALSSNPSPSTGQGARVDAPTAAQVEQVASALSLRVKQVQAVADFLAQGATVPFIARHRKEVTRSLDEVALAAIRDQLAALAELDKRREAIVASLKERGLLSAALARSIASAQTRSDLEDLYLPFRPRRKTRASVARERGLEPLALNASQRVRCVGRSSMRTRCPPRGSPHSSSHPGGGTTRDGSVWRHRFART